MALLKKCNHCSEKGFFLKLTNGLCDNCNLIIENLENDYTNLLQKIALTPNNKSIIKDLNILISKAKPFDGIGNISISTYENLLMTFSEKKINEKISTEEITEDLTEIKNEDTQKITETKNEDTQKKLNSIKNLNLNLKNKKIEEIATDSISVKIKNLIEPLSIQNISDIEKDFSTSATAKTLKLNINSSNLVKKQQAPKLNLKSLQNNNLEINLKNETPKIIETPSIKETFIFNNLKKKCSVLSSKLDDYNTSLDLIAENYFYIKNELLSCLSNNPNFLVENPEIQKTLENTKNTLCIRSKKTEDELFNFFNYVTIFFQTTGLSPQNSDIIEISALKISYGKIIDEFYSLINPIKSIKLSVTNSTGISNEDVEDKPTIDMIVPSLMDFIKDYELVAYNPKPIELFLNSTLKKLNIAPLNNPSISARNLYRIRYKNYHGQPPTVSDLSNSCLDLLSSADIDYINQFKSQSLSTSHAVYKLYEILKYRYK